MPTRAYVAVKLTLTDGRGMSEEALLAELEDVLPKYVEDATGVTYEVKVLGVGTTVKDLQESMTLRREGEKH